MAGYDDGPLPPVPHGAVDGVAPTGGAWLLRFHQPELFFHLFADRHTRDSLDGWGARAVGCRRSFAVAAARGHAKHCGGRDRLVLAFHGPAVGLHFELAGICALY